MLSRCQQYTDVRCYCIWSRNFYVVSVVGQKGERDRERASERADSKKSVRQPVLESQGTKNQRSVVKCRRTTSNQESWLCNLGNKELLKNRAASNSSCILLE